MDHGNRASTGPAPAGRPNVVLTTNRRLAAVPGNVTVAADSSGLESDPVVDVTQIVTLDRAALEQRIAARPDRLTAPVDAGPARALGLDVR